jgi:hypothetical protein
VCLGNFNENDVGLLSRAGAKRLFFGGSRPIMEESQDWGESLKSVEKSQKIRKSLNFSFNSAVKNQKMSITGESPRSRQPCC